VSEKPQPPIRAPLVPIDRAIVDQDGKPTLDFWRSIEAIRKRLGGAEDLPHMIAASGDSSSAQIAAITDDLAKMRAEMLASRAQAGAVQGLADDLARLRATVSAQQEQGAVSGALEDVRAQLAALQASIQQAYLLPRGIDVVTNSEVAQNAGISPDKLAVISEETETYTNTTIVNSAWRIVMKKQIGAAARVNQFFLDGSRFALNATSSADDAGTVNWEARIHETEPTVAGDRTGGAMFDSGTITVASGPPTGNVTFWTPTTQNYNWRDSSVTYPTSSAWIVFWGFVGSGAATEAYMDQVGVGSRIEFTSMQGFSELKS